MNILSIARKDMLILFKDRSTVLQVFVLPLIFIILYVGIGSSFQGDDEEDSRIQLPVVNLDPTGTLSQNFIDNLNGVGGMEAVSYEEEVADQMLEDEEISRLLIIPVGFSEDILAGRNATIKLENEGSDQQENEAVAVVVAGVARNLSVQANILGGLEQMRQMQSANPDTEGALSAERSIEQAKWQFDRAEEEPLIAVDQTTPTAFADREDESLSFVELAVPGMTVLFVFLTAQITAQSVYEEKKVGSFRRLLAAPISKFSLMSGKMLPNFVTVLLQVVVIFFAGVVIFPLLGWDQLSLGDEPLALTLLILVTALCTTSLGALISAIAKTEAQIGGLSTVILWVMAFIGGTIVPFFLVNDTLATLGKVTPQYWAVTGFYDLLVRGQSMSDITDSLLALLLFSAVYFGIAIWRFDFD
jgi:ABC-2 type transport system permease protein